MVGWMDGWTEPNELIFNLFNTYWALYRVDPIEVNSVTPGMMLQFWEGKERPSLQASYWFYKNYSQVCLSL